MPGGDRGAQAAACATPGAPAHELDLAAAYEEYRPAILAYLRRRTGDVHLAEELMQEVFLAALVAQPSLANGRKPLLAWLYVVAKRRSIDAARRARRVARTAPDDVRAVHAIDDSGMSTRAIAEAIGVLPAEEQRVVLLRLFRGCSFAEIGATLGAEAAVCRVRFSRALRTLRRSLGQPSIALLIAVVELASDAWDAAGCCV
jgi:RNA polymerase sigma-70 factor (ECF subfamily)